MRQTMTDYAWTYLVKNRNRRIFQKIVRMLACVVVFCTTYALILPAITMEQQTFCGMEEHVHEEACFQKADDRILICNPDFLSIHIHSGGCYENDGTLICGQADYVVHSHNGDCTNSEGALICPLEERAAHIHTGDCYRTDETYVPVLHKHTDDCFSMVRGSLTCQLLESEGHEHDEKRCYAPGTERLCTTEEGHIHADSCFNYPLICTVSAESHSHNPDCYSSGALICGVPEAHTHGESCKNLKLICPETHDHSAECYTEEITCTIPVGHSHSDSCYESTLTCGREEGTDHIHNSACYADEPVLECSIPEHHMHTDICYQPELICSIPADPGHIHSDNCYQMDRLCICGYEEGDPESPEPVLVCTEPVAVSHVHNDSCFENIPAEPGTHCGDTSEEHLHTDACGTLICGIEAHIHGLSCYSDPDADVESRETWEATMSNVVLTGNWNQDVVSIARSQLGYTESTRNYDVWPDDSIHGYTRYGAWYGVPYGDWCGMFASFCLHYAGVEGMPYHYGVRPWIELLSEPELDLYRTSEEYTPIGGDLVFFDWEGDGLSDHVGIVCEVIDATDTEPSKLRTIEGNSSNCVQYVVYDLDDPVLLGYSRLPEKPEDQQISYYCGLEAHEHTEICHDAEGNLICTMDAHIHTDECTVAPPVYYCGLEEHLHSDACFDADGNLLCNITEHRHLSECSADLNSLTEEDREKVLKVIRMIDEIPSADEIDEKILAFEEVEDYEGEELWMTDVYQKIALTYAYYAALEEPLQTCVVNRQKLLELEYIWSLMPLAPVYIWLDGTNGSLMSLKGSPNEMRQVTAGVEFTLPDSWPSPAKYAYTLRGWYDIQENKYYPPGSKVTLTENTVFYADWGAASYDVGRYNANVVETVSTNDFITTRVFDYSSLFNIYSSTYSGSVSNRRHSETWSVASPGTRLPTGNSFGLVLRDWDEDGSGLLTYPRNFGDEMQYTYQETITTGLLGYNPSPLNLFFNPNNSFHSENREGIMGIQYLGTGDHLFQYDSDPNSETYGYYYYDSSQNAASYNQSAGRFYVYDYLEKATNSGENGSDFLPFNSPYANTNGKYIPTTTTNGTITYQYDDKYAADGYSTGNVGINYWFGMSTDIRFYLPNTPGQQDETGYGNTTMYGDEMLFRFSGDDDVWVLVDGQLILDIGGIHQIKSGTINFSTGVVTVEGVEQTDKCNILKNLKPGEHSLTMYYMERGASQSNCSVYFNMSPRFTLAVQKEDLLSNQLLNGAEFSVYLDRECTIPAELWINHESYKRGDTPANSFTVADGKTSIWGFAAGNTYYIRETKAPDSGRYIIPNGLIVMELSNSGVAHYKAEVIQGPSSQPGISDDPTPGFNVEGFRVDEETQVAYLIVNNSILNGETTDVLVQKVWEGSQTTPVTVYLLADGQRIQEIILSSDNNWKNVWTNLPKFQDDGVTEIQYTVEESSVPGYVGTVERITENAVGSTTWSEAGGFVTNETYLLQSSAGYLATDADGGFTWVQEDTAKASGAAQWTIEYLNETTVRMKNQTGYYLLSHRYGWSEGELYFYADKQPGDIIFKNSRLCDAEGIRYMLTGIDSSGHISSSYNDHHSNIALFTLYQKTADESTEPIDGLGFRITNRPIPDENRTSLTVTKRWTERDGETPYEPSEQYQEYSVPVKLLINGSDSGRSGLLDLRNGWKYTFSGLPVEDSQGNVIEYSVVEDWQNQDWTPQYTDVTQEANGTYSVGISNVYSRTVTIPVEKRWDHLISSQLQFGVQIQLYSAAAENQTGTLVDSITLNAGNDWKGEFQVPPPEENGIQYYIYEPTNSFAAVYETASTIFIDGSAKKVGLVTFSTEDGTADNMVVTNYAIQELPETGGSGTTLYTSGGLLAIAAALLLLYNNIFKRRKEDFVSP